jgi:hypothetical protein
MTFLQPIEFGNTRRKKFKEFIGASTESAKNELKDKYENTKDALFLSRGFIQKVEKTKEKFEENPQDVQKFPKINDDLWK